MERMFKKIISLSLLLSVCAAFADDPSKTVTPKFTIRSQGTNAARRMMGSVGHVMLYDMDKWYGTLSLTPEYTRAFYRDDIAECLFGDSLCGGKTLKIQGSRVENRDDEALLADYFYLPTDFSSEVSFKPLIQNFLVDVNFFLGLDEWLQGLYMFVQSPITYSKWDLNYCETLKDSGTLDHVPGYFSPSSMDRNLLLNSFSEYTQGKAPALLSQTVSGTDINVKFDGLNCAKICGSDTKTSVSELRFALGYNFLLDEDYHLGLNLQVSAPTGNNVKPDYLFAAQNGNDNHWELGGALSASYVFWRSEQEDKQFGFYLDANLTHMFKNCQKRCFDLCGKPLSRYMLAEKMTSDVGDIGWSTTAAFAPPAYQFNNEFAPIANITTLNVDVSVGINADIVAMFNYTSNNWAWDLGYNFWGRSCEKLSLNCDCTTFAENTWAIKGDSQVYGYDRGPNGTDSTPTPIALSATMSKATINRGDNFGSAGVAPGSTTEAVGTRNLQIDDPADAGTVSTQHPLMASQTATFIDGEFGTVQTSINPVLIKQEDINFARTKGISHKIFSHMSYNWFDKECDWIPYVGIGFEAEFATHDSNGCDDDCNSCDTDCNTGCESDCDDDCNDTVNGDCIKCGLSQWGILIKGGVSF